jgi:hypothetical protein
MAILYLHRSRGRMPRPKTVQLTLELLENRMVLSPVAPTITLDPANDEFGAQIQTVTQLGNSGRVTLGILDTGASPITVAPGDQASFTDPVPVKTPGGASADGIGGSVTGDVSMPITVLTDGLHAASVDIDFNTLNLTTSANFTQTSARVNGIQAFIGTDSGSPDMPTISGTPVFAGGFNSASRGKLAARVDLINGVDLYGIGLLEPDVHFVPATTRLVPGAGELLATIPMGRIGDNTVVVPGTDISSNYNFVSNSVQLNDTVGNQAYSLSGQRFLLDTGSQMTVISTAEANALHIDLSRPIDSIDVQGVGGAQTVKGYLIDSLQVGLVGLGPLTFKNVPVFVLDAAPGQIDGILGMNLWNNVDQMLINPFTSFGATSIPTLSITWDPNYHGATNTGAFGFKLDQILSRHQGPPTLTRLLGGAVQYFQVPLSDHDNTPVSTPAQLANGPEPLPTPVAPGHTDAVMTAPTPVPNVSPPLQVDSSQNAGVLPSQHTHIMVGSPVRTRAATRDVFGAWQSQASAPVSGSMSSPTNTTLGAVESFQPLPIEARAEGPFNWLADNEGTGASDPATPLPLGPGYPLAEAALVAALALVVRDYWRQELDVCDYRKARKMTGRHGTAGGPRWLIAF